MSKQHKKPLTPSVILTERYAQAVAYASAIHATQTRKGENNATAYMAHLLGVSGLVVEAGGTEDEAIAGLLHDAVEDCGGMPRAADVRGRFGDDVADIVLACSDSTDVDEKASMDYWQRKQRYLEHLEYEAAPRAVMVSIADKVHNARAIVTDIRIHGSGVLDKFNGTPGEVLTYYVECLHIAQDRAVPEVLLWPLHDAVLEIDRAVMGGAR